MSTSANTIKNLSAQLEEYRLREQKLIAQVAEYQEDNRQLEKRNKHLAVKLNQIASLSRGAV